MEGRPLVNFFNADESVNESLTITDHSTVNVEGLRPRQWCKTRGVFVPGEPMESTPQSQRPIPTQGIRVTPASGKPYPSGSIPSCTLDFSFTQDTTPHTTSPPSPPQTPTSTSTTTQSSCKKQRSYVPRNKNKTTPKAKPLRRASCTYADSAAQVAPSPKDLPDPDEDLFSTSPFNRESRQTSSKKVPRKQPPSPSSLPSMAELFPDRANAFE
ncbi:hypothetical protein P9112_014287 [Eukaryota sp. TZLM1-RC]